MRWRCPQPRIEGEGKKDVRTSQKKTCDNGKKEGQRDGDRRRMQGDGERSTEAKGEERQPAVCPRSRRAARWHMDRCGDGELRDTEVLGGSWGRVSCDSPAATSCGRVVPRPLAGCCIHAASVEGTYNIFCAISTAQWLLAVNQCFARLREKIRSIMLWMEILSFLPFSSAVPDSSQSCACA